LILVREERFVIVDKPSGVSVHKGWDASDDTMMARAKAELGAWVWPVHRLDRATSGCLVFALDQEGARELSVQFESGRVEKEYLALIRGVLEPASGLIEHAIPRTEDGPRVEATTEYERLAVLANRYSLVRARPRTGRLHQIRRHFRHLGHPVMGDTTWGDNRENKKLRGDDVGLRRLALHARSIAFTFEGRRITATAPLPEDLLGPFRRLGLVGEPWLEQGS
jgi:tRNA pseudouridine65 synthase